MSTATIDLNSSTPGNDNAINYADAGSPNPTVKLFSGAAITTTGQNLGSITFSGLTATETLSLGTSLPGFTLVHNLDGTWTLSAAGGASDANWNTVLDNLLFNNSADVPNGAQTITITNVLDKNGHTYTTTNTGKETVNVTCFYAGTLVRTPSGEAAVETLKRGDLVLTHDGRTTPINWLGRQTVSMVFADKTRVLPIRIKAGALGEAIPARDLLVSPDHAMFVDGALIHAGALVNGTSIVRETAVPRVFTYYHIEVEDHSLILAEGAPAETFVDNIDRLGFDNWAEYAALYPNGKSIEELPYPRAKSHRQVPVETRVRLAARAEAIGATAAAVA